MKNIYKLIKLLFPYRWGLVFAIFILIISTLCASALPWMLKSIIDFAPAYKTTPAILSKLIIAFAIFAIAQAALGFLGRKRIVSISREVEYHLRNKVFKQLLNLYSDFYLKMRTGDIMSRVINDMEAIRMALGFGAGFLVSTIFMILFYIVGMLMISPKLTILALLPLALITIVVKIMGARMHKFVRIVQRTLGAISTTSQEVISGSMIIKSFCAEEAESKHFWDLNNNYLQSNLGLLKVNLLGTSVMSLLNSIAVVVVLFVGGIDMIHSNMTQGDFIAFSMYLFTLMWPMVALGLSLNFFIRASSAIERIYEILEAKPSVTFPSPQDSKLNSLSGNIKVDNLCFIYPTNEHNKALHNISFSIKQGQKVAFIGLTASGKSTLIKLLLKLMPVPVNSIFYDNVEINEISQNVFTENISAVLQDDFLFSSTLKENITFGCDNVNDEDLKSVLNASALEKDLEQFENGIEQIVGERGVTLSGGQKQRVSIARALLRKSNIFIFDDCFSSLDADTEQNIINNINNLPGNITKIFVSHRISTISDSDVIFVLDKGEIVEEGTNEDLINKKGLYYNLWMKQNFEKDLMNENGN